MNVNLKEKIAQIYARKGTREAPVRWLIPLLFLALLIPVVAGKLAAAEDQPAAESALVIDVYSGGWDRLGRTTRVVFRLSRNRRRTRSH